MTREELTIDLRPYFVDLREKRVRTQKLDVPVKPGKSITRGILEWAIYAVLFVTLVWGTPAGLKRFLNSDFPIASITSSSMWPELKRGDIVFIQGVDGKADVTKGDIVVFENARGFTIHRIKEMNETTLVTKGDANNIDDEPVRYEQLVGKAVEWQGKTISIPHLGKLSGLVIKLREKIPLGQAVQAGK